MNDTIFPKYMPEILFWSRAQENFAEEHLHANFQLEAVVSGHLHGHDENGDFSLGPWQCRLIAPGQKHFFSENSRNLDFFSIKFRFPQFDYSHKNDQITAALLKNMADLLPDTAAAADPVKQELLAGQLYLLLLELSRITPVKSNKETELLQQINNAALTYGYRMNVNLLADELGLSLSQLKYQFKLKNRTDSPHLKHYLDSILITSAKQHLTFSDMKIRMIAQELQFPDYFAFSRFFKHRTGLTPGEYRRATQNDPENRNNN